MVAKFCVHRGKKCQFFFTSDLDRLGNYLVPARWHVRDLSVLRNR